MLKELVMALKKFNNHAGHNCIAVFNDKEEILIYQTYGKEDCKHWDYVYAKFDSVEECIVWLKWN